MVLRRLDEFSPFVGQEFEAVSQDGVSRLRLEEAIPVQYRGGQGRQDPFRLTFRGRPAGQVRQGVFLIRHPEFGEEEVFLVPNGVSLGEVIYDALFN